MTDLIKQKQIETLRRQVADPKLPPVMRERLQRDLDRLQPVRAQQRKTLERQAADDSLPQEMRTRAQEDLQKLSGQTVAPPPTARKLSAQQQKQLDVLNRQLTDNSLPQSMRSQIQNDIWKLTGQTTAQRKASRELYRRDFEAGAALSPYLKSTGDVDIAAAVKSGVPDKYLSGFYESEAQYQDVKRKIEHPSYKYKGAVITSSAIQSGIAPSLEELNALPDIKDAQDIVKAIDSGVKRETIEFAYGKDVVQQAIQQDKARASLEKYRDKDGYDIWAAVDDGVSKQTIDDYFGKGTYQQAQEDTRELHRIQTGEWVNRDWFESLSNQDKADVNKIGYTKYIDVNYVTDPMEGQSYDRRGLVRDYGKRTASGAYTGEVDWDTFYKDMAVDEVYSGLKEGNIDLPQLENKYRRSGYPIAANAAITAFYDYQKLPTEAKKIYREEGYESLDKWMTSETTKQQVAIKALAPAIDEEGAVDYTKLAKLIHGDTKLESAVEGHLLDMGYSQTDTTEILDITRDIPKYNYNPQSLKDYWNKSLYEEGTTRGLALDILPITSTLRAKEKHGFKSGWTWGNIAGDALIVVPAVRGISVAVKGGQGIGRAVLNEATIAAKGEILGPIEMILHPQQTIRSISAPFASFIPFRKTLPLASVYRGTYAPMSVSKVPAGVTPLAIRSAMEQAEQAMIAGRKSGTIDIEGGGQLHYSSAGIQSELPGTVISATPYGKSFKDEGLVAQGEGVWNAPSAYLGLAHQSAHGNTVLYGFKGKEFKGIISGSKLINDHGRVIGRVDPRDIDSMGRIKPGARIIGDNGKVIAKAKEQPAFVIIQTNGMQALPEWARNIDNINQLEARAWREFGSGKYANDLYPVFKQYRHWIEQEGLLPKGTHMIPVLDNKGKQVILRTRGADGEVIEMPMMQVVDDNWLKTARETTKELGPLLDQITPKMSVEKMLSKVTDIPNPKKSAKAIAEWFRNNPDARLVGSTVEYLHTGKHVPHDIDMGAAKPWVAAESLAKEIENATGSKILVTKNKNGSARLEWYNKNGEKMEMGNIWPISDKYSTTIVDGVRIETPSAQLERALSRMEDTFSGKGYQRFERYIRSAGHKVDLGIGGKAPSWHQIEALRIKGWKNTITDIFNKDMRLSRRLKAAEKASPYLVDDVAELSTTEKKIDDIAKQKQSVLEAGKKQGIIDESGQAIKRLRGKDTPQGTVTKQSAAASQTIRELHVLRNKLRSANTDRARIESKIRSKLARQQFIDEQLFKSLIRLKRIEGNILARKKPARLTSRGKDTQVRKPAEYEEPTRGQYTGRLKESLYMPSGDTPDRNIIDRDILDRDIPDRNYLDRRRSDTDRADRRISEEDKKRRRKPGSTEDSDSEKKEEKKFKGGVVAWQQGEVDTKSGRRSVYVVASGEGSMKGRGTRHVVVTLERPAGMPRATGTPQETLTVLEKPVPNKIRVKVGAFDAVITNGKQIDFNRSQLKYQGKLVRPSNARLLASRKNRGAKRGRII